MLAVGISRGKVYPVDKGSGSITTLALADGIIEIPAGLEYLERGETVEVELFREQDTPDLVVAGENSLILEKIAENLSWRLLTLNTGSLRGRIYLEDGVADLACVSGLEAAPPGLKIYAGYKRELGLVFRNIQAIQEIRSMRVIGWNRDSLLKADFEQTLSEMDLTHPNYVRFARTHSSVAAAIASGRADIGFCERTAAVEAGLGFKFVKEDFLHFIGKPEMEINPCVVPFINSLPV
jgi:putative molybdopterin biosynthesis protein